MDLTIEIKLVVNSDTASETVAKRFLDRLEEGALTRDENPASHFGVHFLPYDPEARKIFIVHHKKSNLWIAPGGHIDRGEGLMGALNREIYEEVGIKNESGEYATPFLLSIVRIDNTDRLCKEHFDAWYRFPAREGELGTTASEFYAARWVTPAEARELITDPNNLEAVRRTEKLF